MDLSALSLSSREGGVRFSVRVKPRATKAAILGLHGDALAVGVSAPPVDGAANAALVRALAKTLSVAQRDVAVVAGQSGRTKVVEVRGLDVAAVRARLVEAFA